MFLLFNANSSEDFAKKKIFDYYISFLHIFRKAFNYFSFIIYAENVDFWEISKIVFMRYFTP